MSLRWLTRWTWRSCGVAALTARRVLRSAREAAGPALLSADLVLDLVLVLPSSAFPSRVLRGSLLLESVFAVLRRSESCSFSFVLVSFVLVSFVFVSFVFVSFVLVDPSVRSVVAARSRFGAPVGLPVAVLPCGTIFAFAAGTRTMGAFLRTCLGSSRAWVTPE